MTTLPSLALQKDVEPLAGILKYYVLTGLLVVLFCGGLTCGVLIVSH